LELEAVLMAVPEPGGEDACVVVAGAAEGLEGGEAPAIGVMAIGSDQRIGSGRAAAICRIGVWITGESCVAECEERA
jgi:hypothetical protein